MNPIARVLLLAGAALAIFASAASAHAFVDHASPAVGSAVDLPPAEVKIWFTENVEPAFSGIEVTNAAGKPVDKKDSHVDAKNHAELVVSLTNLPPGTYQVTWHVVSADTHKTHGDLKFTVKP